MRSPISAEGCSAFGFEVVAPAPVDFRVGELGWKGGIGFFSFPC
jgi:hypothetical protein